jgi:hypothetical protein
MREVMSYRGRQPRACRRTYTYSPKSSSQGAVVCGYLTHMDDPGFVATELDTMLEMGRERQ